MPISRILELYARFGQSLIDNGLNEAVLPVSEARNALELFSQQRWRVLGGDVYELIEGRFVPTYVNWFYEGTSSDESAAAAREVLDGLVGKLVYIVFVVDACPESTG